MFIKENDVEKQVQFLNEMMPMIDDDFGYSTKPKVIPIYLIQAMNPPKIQKKDNQGKSLLQKVQGLYETFIDVSLPKLYVMIEKNFDKVQRLSYKQSYTCQYCGKVFASSCSLGGHISRVHSQKTRQLREKAMITKSKKIKKKRLV